MKNKQGQMTIFFAFLLVAVILIAIFLFVVGLISTKMNTYLDQDIAIGNVTLSEANAATFGQFNTMVINNADWWGLCVIFGLVIGLFLSAYFTRGIFPKFGMILDIFIILTFFIVSMYISATYQTILDAFNAAGEPFLETYTPKTSLFILNLPIFEVIIGVIMMILFHSKIPARNEERYQSGGYLQGAY